MWLDGEVLSYFQINRLSIIFSFQSGGQISTSSRIRHLSSDGAAMSICDAGQTPVNFTLFSLLERAVTSVTIQPGVLEIAFDNGEQAVVERVSNEPEVAFLSFASGHEAVV